MARPSTRARPLSPEDRRASIVAATIPLLLEHGTSVTSRQIAEAAGIAEGTIFRVFADKEALIDAAFDAFMSRTHEADDPLPDPSLSLPEKVSAVLTVMRHRVRDVMRLAAVTGRRPGPPSDKARLLMAWRVREIFGDHANELVLGLDEFADYLRAIAIGTSIPSLDGRPPLPDDDLALVVVGGVLRSADRPHASDRPHTSDSSRLSERPDPATAPLLHHLT